MHSNGIVASLFQSILLLYDDYTIWLYSSLYYDYYREYLLESSLLAVTYFIIPLMTIKIEEIKLHFLQNGT